MLWESLYSGPTLQSRATALTLDGAGSCYVIGTTVPKNGKNDWVTMRLSAAAGKRLWAHRVDGSDHLYDEPSQLVWSPAAKALYVAGSVDFISAAGSDAALARYDAAGHRAWLKTFAKADTNDDVNAMCLDSSGSRLLLAGQRIGTASNSPPKSWLARIGAGGRVSWQQTKPSSGNPLGSRAYWGVVAGPSGSMYLAGYEEPSDTDADLLLEKRSGGGTLAWQADFGWQDGGDDYGGPLALDPGRGVYVCGQIWRVVTGYDAMVQKYKP